MDSPESCKLFPVHAHAVKKGDHVLLDGRPCRVTEVTHHKTGKHGHLKVRLAAYCVLTDVRRETCVPGHQGVQGFHPVKRDWQLADLASTSEGCRDGLLLLSLFDAQSHQVDFATTGAEQLAAAHQEEPTPAAGDYWVNLLTAPWMNGEAVDERHRVVSFRIARA